MYFRDRVLREARYKLFVGPDRKPRKLVDVINDPDEKKDLMADPEFKDILASLVAAVDSLPKHDGDPIYDPLPAQTWDRKRNHKSQVHKVGHPDNPNGLKVPIRKKRNKKGTK